MGTGVPEREDTRRTEAGSGDPLAVPAEVKASLSLLIVDDDRTLREGCASVLQMDGFNVTTLGRGDEALDLVRRRRFDIVIVDLYMTPVSGMEILKAVREASSATLVVVMTGNPSVSTSIEALRAGAWDYLPKPFSATHLQVLVGRASHAALAGRDQPREKRPPAPTVPAPAVADRRAVLGGAPAFQRALDLARKVAATNASVMIMGESGTGKEVFAQFIHANSRRAARAMVPINCAALPEGLLESELFGHRKGAFTGADRDKPGLLEIANGSTLFLDELTEMSLPLQAKLLRVVQDGVVRRVGSEKEDAVVDVRFVSATNRVPQECVSRGILREDLLYRLRVVPIHLPPLRQRPDDIPALAAHFLAHYWERHRGPADPAPRLSDAAVRDLQARPWRGNVRELQNVMEQLAVLVEPGHLIEVVDVPAYDDAPEAPAAPGLPSGLLQEAFHPAKDSLVAQFEQEYLAHLITRAGSNMSKAARLANIDRTTLYRLMEKHGFRRDEGAGPADE